jgi:hypothetical protein
MVRREMLVRSMKLKAQTVYDATLIVAAIIREKRPLPVKGAYRLARLHAKLLPEFTVLNDKRDAMIRTHGDVAEDGKNYNVPDDKMPDFVAEWTKIAEEEIEVDVEPIPLAQLDLGPTVASSIHAAELIVLADLVSDA